MKTTSTNFRSLTMKRAWSIHKTTGKSFAVSLSIAWRVYRLSKMMRDGIVTFNFEKVDGSLRKAKGTLRVPNYAPSTSSKGRAENFRSVVYYDVDRQAFRSLRPENLISINA